jgi:hypothetical protein
MVAEVVCLSGTTRDTRLLQLPPGLCLATAAGRCPSPWSWADWRSRGAPGPGQVTARGHSGRPGRIHCRPSLPVRSVRCGSSRSKGRQVGRVARMVTPSRPWARACRMGSCQWPQLLESQSSDGATACITVKPAQLDFRPSMTGHWQQRQTAH